jgi:hypothetical protein
MHLFQCLLFALVVAVVAVVAEAEEIFVIRLAQVVAVALAVALAVQWLLEQCLQLEIVMQ